MMNNLYKAKNVVSFKTGKLDSNASVENGIYPFFTCSQETYSINHYAFDTECVLLAGNNAAGVFPLKYYSGKFNAYQRTYIIEPIDKYKLYIRYFYYYLRPLLKSFQQQATGATTKFLTIKILNNLDVWLPPLPTQKKIAAILTAYDDLIEANNRRIQLLEKMAEEIYREWFVRLRFPDYQKVKVVKGVPEEWEPKLVKNAFDFLGGGTPSKRKNQYWSNADINWFTPTDITSKKGIFLTESSLKCNEKGINNSSAKIFPAYSLMMTSRATIGAVGINKEVAATNQGFITCIPNNDFPLSFLYFWLKLNKKYFLTLCGGATFPELSKNNFGKITIVKPPQNIMGKYLKKTTPLFDQLENLLEINQNLTQTRDKLLPRLISGKLSVENLNIHFPPSMQETAT